MKGEGRGGGRGGEKKEREPENPALFSKSSIIMKYLGVYETPKPT